MRQIKVIENFLSKKDFKEISNLVLSKQFPWFWIDKATWEETKHKKDQFLCHSLIYNDEINSTFLSKIMSPIENKLKYKKLLRAKLNLNFNQSKHIKTRYHVDYAELVNEGTPFTTAIYYINTNNGYTEFKNSKYKLYSKENTLVIFPGDIEHRGVSQTDESRRVLLNINYI